MHRFWEFALARRLTISTTLVALGLTGAGLAQSKSVELAVGDLDRDGFEDVLVADRGLTRNGGCGEVHAIDGRSGKRLWLSTGVAESRRVGLAVAVLAKGSGAPWVAIGVEDLERGELVIDVLRGASGERICSHRLRKPMRDGVETRCSFAALDDLDGDGIPELAVGRPGYWRGTRDRGAVSIVSLRDGCEIERLEGGAHDEFLGADVASGEFDEHPGRELVARVEVGHAATLVWLSVPGLRELSRLAPARDGECTVTAIAKFGDSDGDGIDEVLVGLRSPRSGATQPHGEVRLYSPRAPLAMRSLAVDGVHETEGPKVAALFAGRGAPELVAVGTPWEDWSAGFWRLFDDDGRAVASHREEGLNDYYAVEVAGARAPRGETARLAVLAQKVGSRDARHALHVVVQCWGGERWGSLLWIYELEPEPPSPPPDGEPSK
ncbi:MAG: hypothetical protein IT453_17255 [Planctomycetes bacterium]|nr:hypothetical protein [Planctomycetota bacterium]